MNRRSFLKYGALSAAVLAVGSASYTFSVRKKGLAANLDSLYDPRFNEAAREIDARTILAELRAKGVIDEDGEIITSVVGELAQTDEAIAYKGRYYTETELELYSLAYLSRESDVPLPS